MRQTSPDLGRTTGQAHRERMIPARKIAASMV